MDRKLGNRFAWALAACAIVSSAGAESRWVEIRRIGPLVCHAEFPLDEHTDLLARLGELQQELCTRLNVPPARDAIVVYLFDTRGAYREFVGKRHPELITRKAGYVKTGGVGEVMAYRSASFEVDLRHECTHALLHAVLPRVPLWIDEGLAEYFELPPEQRSASPHRQAVLWQARLGMPLPLERLEELASMNDMGRGEYRWSWAWTSFLLDGPPAARLELARYLQALQGGSTPRLGDSLAHSLPDAQRQVVEFFKQPREVQPASPASYTSPVVGPGRPQVPLKPPAGEIR